MRDETIQGEGAKGIRIAIPPLTLSLSLRVIGGLSGPFTPCSRERFTQREREREGLKWEGTDGIGRIESCGDNTERRNDLVPILSVSSQLGQVQETLVAVEEELLMA